MTERPTPTAASLRDGDLFRTGLGAAATALTPVQGPDRRLAKQQRSTTRFLARPPPSRRLAPTAAPIRDSGLFRSGPRRGQNLHTGPIPPCLCRDGAEKQILMVFWLPVRNCTGRAGPSRPDEHSRDRFPATFRPRRHGHHADAEMRRSTMRRSPDRDRGALFERKRRWNSVLWLNWVSERRNLAIRRRLTASAQDLGSGGPLGVALRNFQPQRRRS